MRNRFPSRKVVGFATLMMVMSLSGCSQKLTHIPPELIGYWTTDAPGYQTRFLKLEKNFVLIGINQDDIPSVETVREVDSKPGTDGTIYKISSIGSQGIESITLQFNPANGGVIQVRHKEGILWTRHKPPPGL